MRRVIKVRGGETIGSQIASFLLTRDHQVICSKGLPWNTKIMHDTQIVPMMKPSNQRDLQVGIRAWLYICASIHLDVYGRYLFRVCVCVSLCVRVCVRMRGEKIPENYVRNFFTTAIVRVATKQRTTIQSVIDLFD